MAGLRHRPIGRPGSLLCLPDQTPLFQIVKDPKLARKRAYSVVAGGLVLKRGHELAQVLRVFDKTLRLVGA